MVAHKGSALTILFVCPENSARSAMAAGLAQKLLDPSFRILSAVTEASEIINPAAIEVMKELGIDISKLNPVELRKIDLASVNIIVTLGKAATVFELTPNVNQSYWLVPDPEVGRRPYGERLQRFREVRDILKLRMRIFAKEFHA